MKPGYFRSALRFFRIFKTEFFSWTLQPCSLHCLPVCLSVYLSVCSSVKCNLLRSAE
uniref:GM10545p n=1 Tax=Drosophila melanogaster TaxID=7227 RepID=Q8T946_DROME|nr:GM10545p [Drosophila melanogaster]